MVQFETSLQGWKIAVIDDEPDSLDVATIILEMHGAEIYTARDGSEGLELIRRTRPDLIISDLSMPNMTGWELIEALKQGDRALANIPVIALTAHAMQQDRQQAIASGFHNFITKPLQPEKFGKQVIALLAVDHPELRVYLDDAV